MREVPRPPLPTTEVKATISEAVVGEVPPDEVPGVDMRTSMDRECAQEIASFSSWLDVL